MEREKWKQNKKLIQKIGFFFEPHKKWWESSSVWFFVFCFWNSKKLDFLLVCWFLFFFLFLLGFNSFFYFFFHLSFGREKHLLSFWFCWEPNRTTSSLLLLQPPWSLSFFLQARFGFFLACLFWLCRWSFGDDSLKRFKSSLSLLLCGVTNKIISYFSQQINLISIDKRVLLLSTFTFIYNVNQNWDSQARPD